MDYSGSENGTGSFSGTSKKFAIGGSGSESTRSAESLSGIENMKYDEYCDMLKMLVLMALLAIVLKVNAYKYAENKIEFA